MIKLPIENKEFEAINVMLAKTGQVPMISFSDSEGVDPQMALNTLRQVSSMIQAEGWYFNTEHGYPLTRDEGGRITVAEDIIRVDVDAAYVNMCNADPIQRGNKLYDRRGHTYIFADDIEATVVRLLPFGELPEIARQFITLKAAQSFQTEVLGSDTIDQLLIREVERTRAQFYAEHTRVSGLGFLTGTRKSTFGRNIPFSALAHRRLR